MRGVRLTLNECHNRRFYKLWLLIGLSLPSLPSRLPQESVDDQEEQCYTAWSQVTCSNRRAAVRLKEGRSAESRGVVVSRDHDCKKEGCAEPSPRGHWLTDEHQEELATLTLPN
jgi:hypothetical protein